MATVQVKAVFSLEEVQDIFGRVPNPEEIARRREALKNSDKYLQEMAPIDGDVKDLIRAARGDETRD